MWSSFRMKPGFSLALGFMMACGLRHAAAQSSFAFRNYGPAWHGWPEWQAPVLDWSGGYLAGPDWRAELYGGAVSTSLAPLIDVYEGEREIIAFFRPGFFRSGKGVLSVFDVPDGGWAWLQVKVWDVRLGATFEEAVARGMGGYGQSALFYARGGYPTLPTPTPPEPLIGLQSFSVLPIVPEPSIGLSLGGGLAGLWFALRRLPRGRPRPLRPSDCRTTSKAAGDGRGPNPPGHGHSCPQRRAVRGRDGRESPRAPPRRERRVAG
jgi:hypothetical protein